MADIISEVQAVIEADLTRDPRVGDHIAQRTIGGHVFIHEIIEVKDKTVMTKIVEVYPVSRRGKDWMSGVSGG